ncbi:MAG: twin-arginine translocation pathway signal protein [Pseudomonadota bacterium]
MTDPTSVRDAFIDSGASELRAPEPSSQGAAHLDASASEEPRDAASIARALTRRTFLAAAGGGAASAAVAGSAYAIEKRREGRGLASGTAVDEHSPANQQLLRRSLQLRVDRAAANFEREVPPHLSNGDEQRYPSKIGSDTRGLPHNLEGEVDPGAWAALIHALETRDPADFERIKLGGTRRLQQPLGALSVNLVGLASPQFAIPPAPELDSAERAADAVESYWKALLRDVPFHEYRSDTKNELLLAAAAELSQLAGYAGPRDANGRVSPEVLFRGTARYRDATDRSGRKVRNVVPPGVLIGPHVSQFILKDIPYGAQAIPGLIRAQAPGTVNDFITNYDEWLATQDGKPVKGKLVFDATLRRVTTGRDLAEYAHGMSPGFWGASQLIGTAVAAGGLGVPFNATNPYLKLTSSNFGVASFGLGHIQSYIPLAASKEIRANYWQKWFVHRTLRPEAYGGLVHHRLAKRVDYPVHEAVLRSEAVARTFKKQGTYLLSGAYPEAAPNHSSYPGGASAAAAVSATILKAFYDENFVIPDPVQPDPNDPTKLIPYLGPPLTVGGELNKLAANIGQGRNWAGIHFRSDAAASLPHSEEVAIGLLQDEKLTFQEPFQGFEFTRFDGSKVSI